MSKTNKKPLELLVKEIGTKIKAKRHFLSGFPSMDESFIEVSTEIKIYQQVLKDIDKYFGTQYYKKYG